MAFAMDVRKSALESELIRCEKELGMLGSRADRDSMNFSGFLICISDKLKDVHDNIPAALIQVQADVFALYRLINDAISALNKCNISDDSEWRKALGILGRMSAAVGALKFVDEKLKDIRDTTSNTFQFNFSFAAQTRAQNREAFLRELLYLLGDEWGCLQLGSDGAYYDFLGGTSKAHMLSLIKFMER